MERKSPKVLEDIRDAAGFVRQATSGKTLDDYRADRLLRQRWNETWRLSVRQSGG